MDGIAGVMTKIFYQNKPLKLIIMNKTLKFCYFAAMVITGILCVGCAINGKYVGAIVNGFTLVWLINTYFLIRSLLQAYTHIENLRKELHESDERECILTRKLKETLDRAQNAEKQLQQMIDDTPARGADGRFVKREIE